MRDMVVEVEHSRAGKTPAIGLPIKFSETPGKVLRGAPVLGEHTEQVLADLGYSASAIEQLRKDGAVA